MSAARFRLKANPLGHEVTAVRYEGTPRTPIADLLGDRYGFEAPYVLIRGDEDDLRVNVGEWVVRDAWGQFFAAAHENFTAWYEPVATEETLREVLQEIAAYADDFPGSEPMQRVYEMTSEALARAAGDPE